MKKQATTKSLNKKMLFPLAMVALLITGCETTTGDSPSYINSQKCSTIEQFVIKEKKFPENLIHSCNSSKYNVDNEIFDVVEIEYGAAQDCPAGCFYSGFIGAISENKKYIYDIPPNDKNRLITITSLPSYDFNKTYFKCDPEQPDMITTMKLAKEKNKIGWQVDFQKPYICSWRETKSTKTNDYKTFINTGDEITRSWEGSMFVFREAGKEKWFYDKIVTEEIGRKEIIYEEKSR